MYGSYETLSSGLPHWRPGIGSARNTFGSKSAAMRRSMEEPPPSRDMILIPPEGKRIDQIEAEAVRATFKLTAGNRSAAARMLRISRPTLSRKIKKYHL